MTKVEHLTTTRHRDTIMQKTTLSALIMLTTAGISTSAFSATCPGDIANDTFNFTGQIPTYTVPAGAVDLRIIVSGAEGGTHVNSTSPAGFGAIIQGDFLVTPGDQLKILAGEQPQTADGNGGGGGSFVTDLANNPIIIAGGGGGSSENNNPNKHGQAGQSGGLGIASGGGLGGLSGNGGAVGANLSQSGAGGGLLTAGADGATAGFTLGGGNSFILGGAGGITTGPTTSNGGFGGGGGGSNNLIGGGGGGYSGGGSGSDNPGPAAAGGGGSSFNTGTNAVVTAGANGNAGNGQVQICASSAATAAAPSAIPTMSFWGLGLLAGLLAMMGFRRRIS